jgi:hypothetical protein
MLKAWLLVCLILVGIPARSNHKPSDRGAPTSASQSDQRGTEASPLVVEEHAIHSDEETAEESRKDAENQRTNTWDIGLTLAIAICAFLQFLGIVAQALIYLRQTSLLNRTLAEIHTQAGHMATQTALLRDSVGAAQKSAEAAEISAKAVMGVAIPTLVIHEFSFMRSKSRSLEADLEFPRIRISVKNFGQTPALLKSFAVEFTCEERPATLTYPSVLYFDPGTAVEAGQPFLLEEAGVWPWGGFSAETANAISTGSKALSVYGCVWYGDVFGSTVHELRFCKWGAEFAPDGQDGLWIECDSPYGKENPN